MKRSNASRVGELLDRLFQSPDIRRRIAEGSLPETWRKVVGPAAAASTRQVRLVRGVLYVHVDSSIVRSELMFQRMSLVSAINEAAGLDIVRDVIVQ